MDAGAVPVSRARGSSRIIAVTGVDGSGKTTLTDWLREELRARGHEPGFVWSRFNNYTSLPLLAVTRLTGHNYYREHAGVRMGFHDFGRLPLLLRYLFVALQAVDVNIATLFRIAGPSRRNRITICERGPWDTLVDVAADTGLDRLATPAMLALFSGQVARRTDMVLVERSADAIEAVRPELEFDTKLRRRQALYRRLAEIGGWKVLDNNGGLDDTRKNFAAWLTSTGY
jgi:hypothetical protein